MWFQLNIEHCQHDQVEELSERLEHHGALSVTLTDKNDDPVLEPAPGTTPLWPEIIINALFADLLDAENVKQVLKANYPSLNYNIDHLPDEDWHKNCMDSFKPQPFGKRLWVCPSWHTPPHPEAVNLILNPGLAFGTGTHPTTSLCLTWLEKTDLNHKTIIDYGCGSGILALAAVKLGAKHAQAVDIDSQALQATQNNAIENHISSETLTLCSPKQLEHSQDIIIANILLSPLMALKSRFYELLNEKGILAVSGILVEQVDTLINHYLTHFTHAHTIIMDDWALVIFSPSKKHDGDSNDQWHAFLNQKK